MGQTVSNLDRTHTLTGKNYLQFLHTGNQMLLAAEKIFCTALEFSF